MWSPFPWLPGQHQQARERPAQWLHLVMCLLRFGEVVRPLPDLGVAGPPTCGSGRWGQHLWADVLPSGHLWDQA